MLYTCIIQCLSTNLRGEIPLLLVCIIVIPWHIKNTIMHTYIYMYIHIPFCMFSVCHGAKIPDPTQSFKRIGYCEEALRKPWSTFFKHEHPRGLVRLDKDSKKGIHEMAKSRRGLLNQWINPNSF
jgi:hypothetical protein